MEISLRDRMVQMRARGTCTTMDAPVCTIASALGNLQIAKMPAPLHVHRGTKDSEPLSPGWFWVPRRAATRPHRNKTAKTNDSDRENACTL